MRNKYKPYTMIGSRETPPEVLELMRKAAHVLAALGYTGRSGGADGADTCLEDGYFDFLETGNFNENEPHRMEVYLPWKGFNKRLSTKPPYYVLDNPKAKEIAAETHPNWDACKRGPRALHTRNVHQILGKDLTSVSKFVILWAIPVGKEGHVKGGTGQAVRLALKHNVELKNLYYPEVREALEKFVESHKHLLS